VVRGGQTGTPAGGTEEGGMGRWRALQSGFPGSRARVAPGWTLALLLAGCAVPEHRFAGPLPVRTQHHVELQALALGPRRACVLPAGNLEARAQFLWTNTVLAGRSGREAFLFDLETLRLSLPVRVGLGGGFDLELEPALLWAGGGALDPVIEAWHRLFGFPEGFRPLVPENSFDAYVERDGERVLELEPRRVLPADLPIVLSRAILEEGPWLPSLIGRIGLEAPLGSPGAGGGNGGWDFGAGLAATRSLGAMELSGDLSWVLPATPGRVRRQGLAYDARFGGGLGLELPLAEGLAALVQLRAHQAVLGAFELGRLNRSQLLLWVGGRFELGGGLFLEGSVGEDLIQRVSTDVTFHLGLGGRF